MDPPGSSISWRRTVQRKASQVCCTIVPVLHCTLMDPTPAPRTENTDNHIIHMLPFYISLRDSEVAVSAQEINTFKKLGFC